jgi:hypothetical protein
MRFIDGPGPELVLAGIAVLVFVLFGIATCAPAKAEPNYYESTARPYVSEAIFESAGQRTVELRLEAAAREAIWTVEGIRNGHIRVVLVRDVNEPLPIIGQSWVQFWQGGDVDAGSCSTGKIIACYNGMYLRAARIAYNTHLAPLEIHRLNLLRFERGAGSYYGACKHDGRRLLSLLVHEITHAAYPLLESGAHDPLQRLAEHRVIDALLADPDVQVLLTAHDQRFAGIDCGEYNILVNHFNLLHGGP